MSLGRWAGLSCTLHTSLATHDARHILVYVIDSVLFCIEPGLDKARAHEALPIGWKLPRELMETC